MKNKKNLTSLVNFPFHIKMQTIESWALFFVWGLSNTDLTEKKLKLSKFHKTLSLFSPVLIPSSIMISLADSFISQSKRFLLNLWFQALLLLFHISCTNPLFAPAILCIVGQKTSEWLRIQPPIFLKREFVYLTQLIARVLLKGSILNFNLAFFE